MQAQHNTTQRNATQYPHYTTREIKALNSQLVKLEGWKRAERRQIRFELKQLYKEERVRQEKAVKVRHCLILC